MTLRIMLVGLVASLGFELPSGSDVERWSQAGTSWVRARMVDPSGTGAEVALDLARPADCQQADEPCEVPSLASERKPDPDLAFQAVSGEMASNLAADLLASDREGLSVDRDSRELASLEPTPVGLPEGEGAGCLVAMPDYEAGAIEAEVDMTLEAGPVEPDGSTSRVDRVSSAVRLTREAIEAWAAVIQPDVEEFQPSR